MSEANGGPRESDGLLTRLARPTDRRRFLRVSGGAAAAGLLLVACDDDDGITNPPGGGNGGGGGGGGTGSVTIDLSNDVGILNFAYALEQLEAAYYRAVLDSPYGGMTADERNVFVGLRQHEVAHRDFLKAALGSGAIGALTPDFSAVDFDSRASVLGTARVFEDLGVAAYNGAGASLQSADFLLVAGKIVSVEARHASAIRDLLQPRTTYSVGEGSDDVVDDNGLDRAFGFTEVLTAADPFIATQITLQNA